MAEPEVEAAWRAEFRRIHETEAFDGGNEFANGRKAALRWSGDKAEARRLQEEHTHHYLRWTFVGGFAVMIVGLIGVGLSFLDCTSPIYDIAAPLPSCESFAAVTTPSRP